MDFSVSAARRTISGSGAGARISGMPCNSSGKTRLEKPYECASEMTPRFGQSGRKPIVATIFSASAASCSGRKSHEPRHAAGGRGGFEVNAIPGRQRKFPAAFVRLRADRRFCFHATRRAGRRMNSGEWPCGQDRAGAADGSWLRRPRTVRQTSSGGRDAKSRRASSPRRSAAIFRHCS